MMDDVTLYLGDCLVEMGKIPERSVDMVLADLPYGTTACKWDTVIPLEPLWAHYKRITKPQGVIALTSAQPFTSMLVASNLSMYKYCWVWEKDPTGHMNAKRQPLRAHEDVCVFGYGGITNGSTSPLTYHPQGLKRYDKVRRSGTNAGGAVLRDSGSIGPNNCMVRNEEYLQEWTNYPNTILRFPRDKERHHPTQKPVALMEYLIRTYTNEGELVLDNVMGSGTTGVACVNTKRRFIGIEKDEGYFAVAEKRIREAQSRAEQARLFD